MEFLNVHLSPFFEIKNGKTLTTKFPSLVRIGSVFSKVIKNKVITGLFILIVADVLLFFDPLKSPKLGRLVLISMQLIYNLLKKKVKEKRAKRLFNAKGV